jgi:hypothetical protein
MSATAVLPKLFSPYLGLEMISDELQTRLVARIVKDHGLPEEEAREILDATLGFLKLCADHPGNGFAPSSRVDIGYHTLLLYTRDYAAFCERVAGRLIHHEPNDVPGQPSIRMAGSSDTVAFMREHGVAFSPVMWGVGASGLGECTVQECKSGKCYDCIEEVHGGEDGRSEGTQECHGCGTGKRGVGITSAIESASHCSVPKCSGER